MRLIDADMLKEKFENMVETPTDRVIYLIAKQMIDRQPTVESPVKAAKLTKDGKIFDALVDTQRLLIYRSVITYELAHSLGYTIKEVE